MKFSDLTAPGDENFTSIEESVYYTPSETKKILQIIYWTCERSFEALFWTFEVL